ncbi:MAG: hypothetical protein KC619_20700 [Myxococcales bacterium]|nr:hypothetical protein [Myxococcales bacterium]
MNTARRLVVAAFATLLAGFACSACTSMSAEEQACRHASETADCTHLATEDAIMTCATGWENIGAQAEALGCAAQWDAMMACYGRTPYQCSGDNWAECNTEEAAWTACCSSDGRTCPHS